MGRWRQSGEKIAYFGRGRAGPNGRERGERGERVNTRSRAPRDEACLQLVRAPAEPRERALSAELV